MASIEKKIDKMFMAQGCLASLGAMKPEAYNSYCQSKIDELDIINKGMKKLGLEPEEVSEIPPLLIWGYGSIKGITNYYTNALGSTLSPIVSATAIYFSESRIYIYSHLFDTTNPNVSKVITEEFSYKDVTSVSVDIETDQMLVGKKQNKKVTVKAVCVTLKVYGERFSFACFDDGSIEQKVKGMKNKIKEHKD